jgi:uncharacterized protein (TIGR00290 family)
VLRGLGMTRVGILYSGGKDSTYAIEYAQNLGYDIKYLLSVKPNRKDCYLFHYATVEYTKELAEILGLPHKLITCDVAEPMEEAKLVYDAVKELPPVDLILLGGVGLQETQIKSIRKILEPFEIEVRAAFEGREHESVLREMIKKGYDIRIVQYASAGFSEYDLGLRLGGYNINGFVERAKKYGFHVGGEGGHYDTLVVDGPIFKKKLEIEEFEKVVDGANTGHIEIKKARALEKEPQPVFTIRI